MAKKGAPEPAPNRGLHDLIGIVLMGCAILLLIALFSYDAHDRSEVQIPPNHPIHTAIGPFAPWVPFQFFWVAFQCIRAVGATAYLLPFMCVFIGLGCFFQRLAFVRRRWIWAAVLFVC